ncbi:glycogen debranching protein, partial [Candidatus Bathyarchaeota archaeon]
ESIRKFEDSICKEWIITNGLGGYASSTVLGLNTRKYHGLLVAAFNPPVNRHVLLEKLDEEIIFENEVFPLYSNEFKHGIIPEGFSFLQDFYLNPTPTYRYNVEGIEVLKRIVMPYKKNAVVVSYEVFNPHLRPITLKIYPRVNARHFHSVTCREKLGWSFVQTSFSNGTFLKIERPRVFMAISSGEGRYVPSEKWVDKVFYRIDASRRENPLDDYYQPGSFHFEITANTRKKFYILAVGASNEEYVKNEFLELNRGIEHVEALIQSEVNRLRELLNFFYAFQNNVQPYDWLNWLVLTADSFVVSRKSTNGFSVIAGYHWFEDWGRDSLISLPGLTLVTGKFEKARQILLTFKHYCQNGIVPNRFPDKTGDKPVYNTVDATLWFFNAVLQYLKYTGDLKFIKEELWFTLKKIVDYHVKGTIYGIKVDKDGLLAHGPQLTWMDSVIEGKAVTPRSGRAVEVQALWYNALKTMEKLAICYGEKEEAERYFAMAEKTKRSFNEKFWNTKTNCLFDVIHDDGSIDDSLRPNQIIAVALDFSMLSQERSEKVVNAVWKKLQTPYGLRTLSSDDARYRGKYVGGWNERNLAYHNGTAWPWLLGPFVTAFLKVKNYEEKWRIFAFENFLKELFTKQLFKAGLGTISEIFDGDYPHLPRGCISQAWSTAEPLRAYVEDILFKRPPFERQILNGSP